MSIASLSRPAYCGELRSTKLTVRWIEGEEMGRGGGEGWWRRGDGGRMRMEKKTHCHSFALTRNFRQRVVRRENSPLMKAPTKIVAVPMCLKDLPYESLEFYLPPPNVVKVFEKLRGKNTPQFHGQKPVKWRAVRFCSVPHLSRRHKLI